MRLSEAFAILQKEPGAELPGLAIFLVCGFTPLHLETFLKARLRLAFPQNQVFVQTGLFGDFLGNLEGLNTAAVDYGVIVMEWPDVDPRLGMSSLKWWRSEEMPDVMECARARLAQIRGLLHVIARRIPVVLSLPTIPLPPIEIASPGWKTSVFELQLQQELSTFALQAAQIHRVKIVNSESLECISPSGERFDTKGELFSGFPYKLHHVDAMSELLTKLICEPAPKKGLITDLDGTFWKGLVGEVGAAQISWSREQHSYMHALYQQLLCALSEAGVLLAVASKNDPQVVEEAFRRNDLICGKDRIFPLEVHWRPKSDSVTRILETWNIGPDSVVFVDDSPLELAEVKSAHPAVECIQFPQDPDSAYDLLRRLRDLFAKGIVTEEDRLRMGSIRAMQDHRNGAGLLAADPDSFLAQAGGELILSFDKSTWDPRVLELINKTNQFNLNGKRYTETALRNYFDRPDTFLLKASYQDKYGPLGKIAIILGRSNGDALRVDTWVMSCRAFSRRIEHQCLKQLYERFSAATLEFEFTPTERNGPLREFFAHFLSQEPDGAFRLPKETIRAKSPRLFHRVEER